MRFTTHEKTLQPYLLQDRFERQWSNTQHRYSTRFAAMLQNTLHVFCCPFYCNCLEKTKNKTTLHVQHTFLNISSPLFCTTTTWNFLVERFIEEMSYVFLSAFFSLPLIFSSVTAFSVSHRRYIIIFMLFFPRKWFPLFFISRPSSFFVIRVSVDIKIKSEKKNSALTAFNSSLYGWRI